ncbi:FecR family protein [Variovorax sp. PAMC26660]|uniref:FecR family protein n=1 Tax=Variovorax sp. PAMC26660 TaxID=2762322 RepID=UPI00164D9635|nr:FecR domain-containing protein [Variovorax sp. PAMC26660]QNK65732.1 FecR domain-containing protein [Variovorax sp. PAMC26660]
MTVPRDPGPRQQAPDALDAQAQAWVRRLASGAARPRDARALKHWCAISEAHAQAFRKAHRQWRELLPAATLASHADPELARLRTMGNTAALPLPRRMFLGGAVAASAAAIGVALVRPPLDLWPSVQALQADFRTGVGEQRKLALTPTVTVEMNTRSSLGVRAANGQPQGIDLIDGEVSVNALRAAQPFTVVASEGRVSATDARFEVRRLAEGICVTCIEGQVRVATGGSDIALMPSQQVVYDRLAMGAVRQIDAAELSPWREGILSFRKTALTQVVAEINRYRPGRVVLLARSLGDRPVSGRFHIGDLDKAIAQIQRLFRLDATSLPGAIVVLS